MAQKERSGFGDARPISPNEQDPIPSQHLNPGAKRKLSTREEEEPTSDPTAVGKDDFKFNRRHGAGTLNSASREDDVAGRHQNPVSTKITEDLAAARGVNRSKSKDGTVATAPSARKALEPSKS